MIKNFRTKGLKELNDKGKSSKISLGFHAKILRILSMLEAAEDINDLNVSGYDFHGLRGKPKRYSMHVNGNFCITFEFAKGVAINVKLEDYH